MSNRYHLASVLQMDAVEAPGHTDALKLHSCMTLFHCTAPQCAVSREVLDAFYAGELYTNTCDRIEVD
jgi:uncharacterized protein (DUF1810 family)